MKITNNDLALNLAAEELLFINRIVLLVFLRVLVFVLTCTRRLVKDYVNSDKSLRLKQM